MRAGDPLLNRIDDNKFWNVFIQTHDMPELHKAFEDKFAAKEELFNAPSVDALTGKICDEVVHGSGAWDKI